MIAIPALASHPFFSSERDEQTLHNDNHKRPSISIDQFQVLNEFDPWVVTLDQPGMVKPTAHIRARQEINLA